MRLYLSLRHPSLRFSAPEADSPKLPSKSSSNPVSSSGAPSTSSTKVKPTSSLAQQDLDIFSRLGAFAAEPAPFDASVQEAVETAKRQEAEANKDREEYEFVEADKEPPKSQIRTSFQNVGGPKDLEEAAAMMKEEMERLKK